MYPALPEQFQGSHLSSALNRILARIRSTQALVYLALVLCLGACSESKVDYMTLIDNGEAYFSQGQFRASMIEASNALQQDPKRSEAHMLLARIYYTLGQGRVARQELDLVDHKDLDYQLLLIRNNYLLRKYGTALVILGAIKKELVASDELTYFLLAAEGRVGLKQYAQAEDLYNQALGLQATNAKAILGLAFLEAIDGNLLGAQRYLDEVLAITPNDVNALILKSRLMITGGNLEAAEQLLTEAITALPNTDIYTPQRSRILITLSSVLTRQGRTGEALVYTRMLAEAFPQARELEDSYQRAIAQIQSGNLIEAESVLTQILERVPGAVRPSTMLGVVNYLQGDNESAVSYFSDSVDAETASQSTLQYFALSQLRLEKPYQVMSLLSGRIASTKDVKTLALYAIAALSAEKALESRQTLERAIEIEPENARLRMLLAQTYGSGSRKDSERKLAELSKAHELEAADPFTQGALMRQLLEMGRKDEAANLVQQILNDYPEASGSYLLASVLHDVNQDFEQAVRDLQKALSLARDDTTIMYRLAGSYVRVKNWSDAEETYLKVADLKPDEPNAYRGLIAIYENQGKLKEGIDLVEQLGDKAESEIPLLVISDYFNRKNQVEDSIRYLNLAEGRSAQSGFSRRMRARVYYAKAQQALRDRDFTEARSATFTALSGYPGNQRLLGLLAHIEIIARQFGEARKVIDEIRRVYPNLSQADLLTGDLYLAEDDPANAIQSYQRAWQRGPNDVIAAKLAGMLIEAGRNSEFEAFSKVWQEVIPHSRMFKYTVAGYMMSHGKELKAIELYEEILAIDGPRSADVLNNLAWLYARNGNLPEGLKRAEQAYKIAPQKALILDTYGWLLFLKGDTARSVALLETAKELLPDSKEIQEHLGQARRALR